MTASPLPQACSKKAALALTYTFLSPRVPSPQRTGRKSRPPRREPPENRYTWDCPPGTVHTLLSSSKRHLRGRQASAGTAVSKAPQEDFPFTLCLRSTPHPHAPVSLCVGSEMGAKHEFGNCASTTWFAVLPTPHRPLPSPGPSHRVPL